MPLMVMPATVTVLPFAAFWSENVAEAYDVVKTSPAMRLSLNVAVASFNPSYTRLPAVAPIVSAAGVMFAVRLVGSTKV